MNISIGIATKGRREILAETVSVLRSQTRLADRIFICPAGESDLPRATIEGSDLPIEIVTSSPGLCAQRNAILRQAADVDILLFIDDDFFLSADFLANCETLFQSRPDVIMCTGNVIADGISGPGITPDQASEMLMQNGREAPSRAVTETYGGYGCNMAFRVKAAVDNKLWFDERLPLYGWQEDVDFSRRLSRFGGIVNDNSLRGVHLGHKSGRTEGLRLGYSQVANPLYLLKNGTVSLYFASQLMARNALNNLIRSPFPEPWVDRRGRLRGNFLAFRHLLQGKLDPEMILKL